MKNKIKNNLRFTVLLLLENFFMILNRGIKLKNIRNGKPFGGHDKKNKLDDKIQRRIWFRFLINFF